MKTVHSLRALARFAWRSARRSRARTALIMTTIALPIAGLAFAAVLISTVIPSEPEIVAANFGIADVSLSGQDDAARVRAVEALMPDGSRSLAMRVVWENEVVRGEQVFVAMRESNLPADDPMVSALYDRRSGTVPARPGEALVHPRLSEVFDVREGGTITIGKTTFTVTGTVVARASFDEILVLAAPGSVPAEQGGSTEMYVKLPPRESAQALVQAASEKGFGGMTVADVLRDTASDRARAAAAAFGVALAALFGTGMIASAAFAVGVRRQLRALGMLSAIGGETRHVRAAVLMSGVTTGLAASLVGAAIGAGLAAAAYPAMEGLLGREIGRLEIGPGLLGGAVLLGVVVATIAAWIPARAVVRAGTLAALAGRMPAPPPAGRVARRAIVTVFIGMIVAGYGTSNRSGTILGVGFVVMLLGFLLAVPGLVALIGKAARMLPASMRLAARDTARHGRRTGAAMAAAGLALTVPVAVGAMTASQTAYDWQNPPLDEHQIQVGVFDSEGSVEDVAVDLRRALPKAAVGIARPAIVEDTRSLVLPGFPEGSEDPYVHARGGATTLRDRAALLSDRLYVADAAMLDALGAGAHRDALADGKVVTLGVPLHDGGVTVRLGMRGDGSGVERRLDAVRADVKLRSPGPAPLFVIGAEAAAKLGVEAASAEGIVVRTPDPVTALDVRNARSITTRHPSAYVSSGLDAADDMRRVRVLGTGGSVAAALVIVAVAIALVGAESRRDQAILVAVGAGPMLRRKVAGARAALMTLCASMLAVPAGIVPVAVIQSSRTASYPIVVPWGEIAIVAICAPLAAALVAALASKAPRPMAMLRPVA